MGNKNMDGSFSCFVMLGLLNLKLQNISTISKKQV